MAAEDEQDIASYLHEHARDIILVIDATSGRIVEANRAAELAYGYTRDELLARAIFDLRVESTGSVSRQMHRADHDGILFETLHRRADGTTFPVEVSSRGDGFNQHRFLFSVIRDISERYRLEAEREELLATTQRALALRDEFLLVASHELRTPVANVGLQLQQLRRLLDRAAPPERVRTSTESAIRELARLASLIDALLDAQNDRVLELALAPCDIAEIVGDVVERQRAYAELVGSRITVDVPSMMLVCDRARIDQVLVNLVTNALKYGARHPIEIRAVRRETDLAIEVRDHGIGVADADAARIFGKFERAVPSGNYSGFGVGLYIARRIVEAHGGRIEVESAPAVGATFRVVLPI